MKPLFVSFKDGRREIHWPKLAIVSTVVLVASAAVAELLWSLVVHQPTLGAALVGLIAGILIVVRTVVRVLSYQEQEMEATVESS